MVSYSFFFKCFNGLVIHWLYIKKSMKISLTQRIRKNFDLLINDFGRIWRVGALHIGTSQGIANSIGIVRRILLARILGAANIGNIAVVKSSLELLKLPAGIGMFTPVTKLTAEKSSNSFEQSKVLATGSRFVFCTSCLTAIISIVLLRTTSVIVNNVARDLLSIVVLLLPLMALSQILQSSLAGQMRMRLIAKIEAFLPVAGFITAVLLCYFWSLNGWILNHVAWVIIGFFIYFFFVRTKIFIKWDVILLRRMLRIGMFAFLGRAVGTILLHFDTLCISGIMKDPEATGIYNTAAIASQQLMVLIGGILYTVFPYVAKNCNDLPKLFKRYKELSLKLMLLTGFIGLCAWLISPFFFPLFGQKFVASTIPFRILIIGFFCRVQFVLANTYLDALGRTDITFISGLLAAISNIILNVLFIPKWGIIGAAWATVISLFFSMLIRIVTLKYFIFYKKALR